MGLIKAGFGAIGGVLADQWKEFFYCEAMDMDTLVVKGSKRISGRSSNTKASDNIISNGSGIAVADGQCMIIVEQGKVVEVCAEPGEYTYDTSTEPSVFSGSFGKSLKESFKTIGKRFGYGGDTGKDQRVYYVNTKEIMGNKFGTPSPIIFEVINKRIGMSRTVNVRCNGVYSFVISDPLLFYTKVCGNIDYSFTRDQISDQMKAEFVSALQPAFGALAELELRPAQITAKANELKTAMNQALRSEWVESRGITVEKIALNPITLNDDDMQKIQQMEDAATLGANPFMMAGRMTDATASAMENAAENSAGAMTGFMGMGMAGGAMGGGFNAAQELYNSGVRRMRDREIGSWLCSCGTTNHGNFCQNCGGKNPQNESWTCSCGTVSKGKFCQNCGLKRPENDKWTCFCGTVNTGKFCENCGERRR